MNYTYESTKTYGHEVGLSCVFRQPSADSHCSFLHGYALSFKFTFGADKLTKEGWVVDFGGLKSLKSRLQDLYDHKLIIGLDDDQFCKTLGPVLGNHKLAQVRYTGRTGCEAFAKEAFEEARYVVGQLFPNAHVISCEVREHGGNSAIYRGENNG